MNLDLIQKFVIAVVPGMVACAAIMWLGARVRPASASGGRSPWAAPLALGAALMAAFLVINRGLPGWPPEERWMWLAWMNVAGVAFALIAVMWQPARGGRLMICLAVALVMAAMLHPTKAVQQPWAWQIALGLAVFVLAFSLDALTVAKRGTFFPSAICVSFSGASALAFQAGFASLSLIIIAIALSVIVIAVCMWRVPSLDFATGAVPWIAAMLPAILAIAADDGYNAGDVPRACFVMVGLSPLMLWVGETRGVRSLSPNASACIRLALVAAPVIVAVAMAMNSG